MDHIRQRDWCSSAANRKNFVEEEDIDNCVVERIIRNKFWDPLISSDEDEPVGNIDWDRIFNKKSSRQQQHRLYVPGFRKAPPYPKLSALSPADHIKGIKVLCAQNNQILPNEFLGRPMKKDYSIFEEKKEEYEKEQQEYKEWAKQLWQSSNCIRALRPKPIVELVYDTEFKMHAHKMQCFPKAYTVAAQIPLKAENHKCEMILPKSDLVRADMSKLPKVCYPHIYEDRESILRECSLPKPCNLHPTNFKLPNESELSMLPLTELHKELAQYALDNGVEFVASENAIRCLLETDRSWTLPVSVCEVLGPDGDKINIVVLDNEFPDKRDPATVRSYRAFRHLLLNAFTNRSYHPKTNTSKPQDTSKPNSKNVEKKFKSNISSSHKAGMAFNSGMRKLANYDDEGDSDSEDRLQIDIDENTLTSIQNPSEVEDENSSNETTKTNEKTAKTEESQPRKILRAKRKSVDNRTQKNKDETSRVDYDDSDEEMVIDVNISDSNNKSDSQSPKKADCQQTSTSAQETSKSAENVAQELNDNSQENDPEVNNQSEQEPIDVNSLLECVCEGTDFDTPNPRSYKKVQFRNYSTNDHISVLIHSSHKLRKDWSNGEVLLEPILEYQLEIGGTVLSPQKIESLAFALMLRKNADLAFVRVDGSCGELVALEFASLRELTARHTHCSADSVANTTYTALCQLAGLMPGHYTLRHEPSHGANAVLYSRAVAGSAGAVPLLKPEPLSPADEARLVSVPPTLGPVLLPIHKFIRQLPLTFTYNKKLVVKPNPNAVARKPKLPPAAIQWPKKRGRKKKKKKSKD